MYIESICNVYGMNIKCILNVYRILLNVYTLYRKYIDVYTMYRMYIGCILNVYTMYSFQQQPIPKTCSYLFATTRCLKT